MANFNNNFQINDEYMTPFHVWDDIKHFIPNDKIIWECFPGTGLSKCHLEQLGFNVVSDKDDDFYHTNKGDIIITNPPFSDIKNVIERLIHIDKPFILIMPCSKLTTQYFQQIFKHKSEHLSIIIPKKRVNFLKVVNGKPQPTNSCNFDCFYYCYKMPHIPSITFL